MKIITHKLFLRLLGFVAISLTVAFPLVAHAANGGDVAVFDDIEYVFVPGGDMMLGDDNGRYDEQPAVSVRVSGFWIARYEVTNRAFTRFVQTTGYQAQGPWQRGFPRSADNLPVRFVTWFDADAYVQWAGCQLPTEAQWRAAADSLESPVSSGAILQRWSLTSNSQSLANGPVPVTSGRSDSSLGIMHLNDNVQEWTADWYYRYQWQLYAAGDRPLDPTGPADGAQPEQRFLDGLPTGGNERSTIRAVRGASWAAAYPEHLSLSRRIAHNPHRWHNDVGLRCIREVADMSKVASRDVTEGNR